MTAERKWTIDNAHSSMEFSIKHMMISNVRGKFDSYEAEITGDGDDIQSMKAHVSIDVKSINTGNNDRDNHLRSDEIFASVKYPKIEFQTKKIELSGDELDITGDLTIKGITKEITLMGEYGGKIKDPFGNDRFGLSVSTSIKRSDFDLKWNMVLEGGGLMLGEKVTLLIQLEAFSPSS